MLQETKKPGGVSKNEVQFETLNDTMPHSQNFVMFRSASTRIQQRNALNYHKLLQLDSIKMKKVFFYSHSHIGKEGQ